ncbi:hypothetical protein ABB37_05921 [Leptomonas pyrrhocoris]|uniref:Uncharacterized protein n=1 Tax=Leptomonas pyrrhocoris TaxID=157538 RepID=A0A0N0DUF2_LEPPY|nr:hypothetical protein ABB37_05921 [Leptomonas pyrrhocoris]KPA78842.1 hypothetical protein ABB37_05921 [Leptomonas pyrrhocoris]|eukprot:XP_015657281.1 hypothetical protein ABB37_05921 [Leptomonas pyrrhocoris]
MSQDKKARLEATAGGTTVGALHDVPHSPFAEETRSPDNVNGSRGAEIHATEEGESPLGYSKCKQPAPEWATQDIKQPTRLPQAAPAPTAGAAPPRRVPLPLPDDVVFRKSPDKDDFGYKAVLESVSNPQTINYVRGAFRTTAFVALPLFTIAVHPNTMYRLGYPMMLIASVISTSTHQTSLGMQIGVHSWLWRGVVYMLLFGTVMNTWNVHKHAGAWYGMLVFGIFLASLVSHGMMRRFMYLYFFIYLLEIRSMSASVAVIPLNSASWSAADFFIGSLVGVAALCFPYPILTKSLVDMIMTKIFEGLGKMFMAMVTFVWMPDPHAAVLFFNDRSPFMKIEAVLEVMPPLLWFANWEPTEFPLHNPVRRLKLSLLRRIMALTYAAFGAGHTVATIRRLQSEQMAMHKIRVTLFEAVYGRSSRRIGNGSMFD